MKAKYKDFIKENPTCSQFKENKDMKALFRLLNSDPMIIQMIESADQDKPALAGVLGALEAWYRDKKAPSIDLGDHFTKTAVGRIIKTILRPFGYRVTRTKDLAKDLDSLYFRTAACYCYDPDLRPSMEVIKKVREIPEEKKPRE